MLSNKSTAAENSKSYVWYVVWNFVEPELHSPNRVQAHMLPKSSDQLHVSGLNGDTSGMDGAEVCH